MLKKALGVTSKKTVYLQTLDKKEGGWSKPFQKYLNFFIFSIGWGQLNPVNLTNFRVTIEKTIISLHVFD